MSITSNILNFTTKLQKNNSKSIPTVVIKNGVIQAGPSDHSFFSQQQQTLIIHHQAPSKSLRILFVSSKSYTCELNLICEEYSQLKIIEEHLDLAIEEIAVKTTINLTILTSSTINYFRLTANPSNPVNRSLTTNLIQHQASNFNLTYANLPGLKSTSIISAKFLATKAICKINGLNLGINSQIATDELLIEHLKSDNSSQVLVKNIVDHQATSRFKCLVITNQKATGTKTKVINKNLLLSKEAKALTTPELEIYNNEVSCTHGATIGQIDQRAIFYLRSRGLNHKQSLNLLTQGFAQEIIDQLAMVLASS